MGYAELLKAVQALPREKQSEVFDFVSFLVARCGVTTDAAAHDEWTEDTFAQFSMDQAMRGMEQEPALYTLDDLKERWQ